ncbi:MAG: glycosyltransferase, partial [Lentisphaeria bacterium]|nr:glycosyltransferase [Lentisphaeria bacterium]
MKLSVICPIFNEEKYIEKCIQSVIDSDFPKEDMELLLIDGNSTDRTREIISEYSS